jgi:DNA repair protein RadD
MQLDFLTLGTSGRVEVNPLYRWQAPPSIAQSDGLTLRSYQEAAVTATLEALAQGEHPCLMLPTGSGKALCIAALCDRLPQTARILVVTQRQELVEQDSAELETFVTDAEYGIYAAGLDRRDTQGRVIFGSLGSIYARMDRLQDTGAFTYIMVDEAHRINKTTKPSMYRTIFESCPTAQRIGLTATPYRLDSGPIFGGDENYLTALAYEVGIRALTPEYLAPLRGIQTAHDIDLSGVRTRAGEYATSDLSQAACQEDVVEGALTDMCALGAKRKAWMVFCVDVAHAHLVTQRLRAKGITAEMVVGTTPKDDRRALVQAFRDGQFQAFINVEVGTTGFNVPQVDLVALFYSTKSKCKLVQTLGRGTRQSEFKQDCLVLDFGSNLERHLPLDDCLCTIEPTAEREEQEKKKAEAVRERALKHQRKASDIEPFGEGDLRDSVTYPVGRITYQVKVPSRDYTKRMLVATYHTPSAPITQYICVEHSGIARQKAELWFSRRGLGTPVTAEEALHMARNFTATPTAIVVRMEKGWPRILLEHLTSQRPRVLTPPHTGDTTMPLVNAPRLAAEVGKIRIGDRIENPHKPGEAIPHKLTKFAFTSNNPIVLRLVAERFGGTVEDWKVPATWKGTPPDHKFRVYTEADVLPAIIRPSRVMDTTRERWEGGWCVRRCNSQCILMDAYNRDLVGMLARARRTTFERRDPAATRPGLSGEISRIVVQIHGLPAGNWRVDTKAFYGPAGIRDLSDFLEECGRGTQPIPVMLRLQQNTARVIGPGKDRKTGKMIEQAKLTHNYQQILIEPIWDAERLALGPGSRVQPLLLPAADLSLAENGDALTGHPIDLTPHEAKGVTPREDAPPPGPTPLDEMQFHLALEALYATLGLEALASDARRAIVVAHHEPSTPAAYETVLAEETFFVTLEHGYLDAGYPLADALRLRIEHTAHLRDGTKPAGYATFLAKQRDWCARHPYVAPAPTEERPEPPPETVPSATPPRPHHTEPGWRPIEAYRGDPRLSVRTKATIDALYADDATVPPEGTIAALAERVLNEIDQATQESEMMP